MSYIGNQPPDIGAYEVQSFDGGGTEFTLQRAATTPSVLLFIDGVRQTPTDAYSVSGTTLTTTGTTPSGTDNVTVMFMGDVVDIGTPSDDTVSTAKIQDDAVTSAKIADGTIATADIADDAVTADKLANSINTEIAANTAKVTNATHTGDVTGATALTIAADAVDIAMLSATGTASATTFLRGDNAWASPSSGLNLITSATNNTAVAQWNFGDCFDDGYRVYLVQVAALPVASAQEIRLKIGVSNLSSYESFGFTLFERDAAGNETTINSTSADYIDVNNTGGAGEPPSFNLYIYNPLSSTEATQVVGQSVYYHTSGGSYAQAIVGAMATSAASSPSMALACSSGNIGSSSYTARVSIYGLAES